MINRPICRWALHFTDGTILYCVGPVNSSAWYLYWKNGYLVSHGREFFEKHTALVFCGVIGHEE